MQNIKFNGKSADSLKALTEKIVQVRGFPSCLVYCNQERYDSRYYSRYDSRFSA